MSRRINITLPDKFISRAVLHFIESQGNGALRERLKAEALAHSVRDTQLAVEWFTLDEEASAITSPVSQ